MPTKPEALLGEYLRDRRRRLDPATFGYAGGRRRTPGLRREEVAHRACISPVWYTWLEQGRGGAPSADVLERIAQGLMLTQTERDHLFILGLGHLPEARYSPVGEVPPRLQRLLNALDSSPAIVKTATWDVVAWNQAAAVVLTDYGAISPQERNVLRLVFCDPRIRESQVDWQDVARFLVGAFRADVARAGAGSQASELVESLRRESAEFRALWDENDVRLFGEGTKRLRHRSLGLLELEYSAFEVQGRPDLGLIVYNPASAAQAELIRSEVRSRSERRP